MHVATWPASLRASRGRPPKVVQRGVEHRCMVPIVLHGDYVPTTKRDKAMVFSGPLMRQELHGAWRRPRPGRQVSSVLRLGSPCSGPGWASMAVRGNLTLDSRFVFAVAPASRCVPGRTIRELEAGT